MTLSFAALSAANLSRCAKWHPGGVNDWDLADWLIAVGGELGEALNVLKKLRRDADGIIGNKDDAATLRAQLAEELADVVIYLDIFAARAGVELQRTIQRPASDFQIGPKLAAMMALMDLGVLADCCGGSESKWRREAIRAKVRTLFLHLNVIAEAASIDLDDAIIAKFNKVSEKHSFPERLSAEG